MQMTNDRPVYILPLVICIDDVFIGNNNNVGAFPKKLSEL